MKITLLSILSLIAVYTVFITGTFAEDSTQWKLPEGAIARIGKGWINQVQYFRDGSRFAVASSIGIWIYDAHTGEELDLLTEQVYRVYSIAFTADGNMFATGDSHGRIFLWDAHTGQHNTKLTELFLFYFFNLLF